MIWQTLEALADAIDTGGDVAGTMMAHAVALRKSMADEDKPEERRCPWCGKAVAIVAVRR